MGLGLFHHPLPLEKDLSSNPMLLLHYHYVDVCSWMVSITRYVPYVAKRDEPKTKAREGSATRPKLRLSYKELLSMPGVADKLNFPSEDRSILGIMKRCLV